jgi:signal transduction histidine kinase
MAGRAVRRLVVPALALISFAAAPRSNASDDSQSHRTVLTVYWSSESFTGTPELDAVIQRGLQSDTERIDYFAEYLESDRFPDEQASAALSHYIREKVRDRRIDVVIAVTDVALQFALRYRAALFPGAPIVFSAVSPPEPGARADGPGVTGLLSGVGFGETLQLALKLHPSTTRVFFVAEASDSALRESMRMQLRAVARNVELTDVNETSLPRLIGALKAIPAGSVVLYVRYSQDDAGNVLFPSEVAPIVAGAAGVPVYGVAESYVGSGIVGGVVLPRQVIGARLAEMAREILHGRRPEDIPIERPPLVPMFDWRQLQRWGIAPGALPSASVVLFREVSVWERYRATIVVTIVVLLLQTSLIVGLMIERKRRHQAEIESRRNLAALSHLDRRAAMGELATSLAHELNQPLNAILQNAGVAEMLLSSNGVPPALAEMVDIIGDIRKDDVRASELIRRMRGLLQKHELESQRIDLNHLTPETVAIVQADARSRAIELETDLEEGVSQITGDRVHLQQVLLNLLMNAMDAVAAEPPGDRHVRVSVRHLNGEVRVAVADTGCGIPPDRLSRIFEPFYTTKHQGTGMGMGLAIARSIVDAHGGRLAAENNAGRGATVWFSLPAPDGRYVTKVQ